MVYVPTWIVDFYGKLVGKYTSPMDPMGIPKFPQLKKNEFGSSAFSAGKSWCD